MTLKEQVFEDELQRLNETINLLSRSFEAAEFKRLRFKEALERIAAMEEGKTFIGAATFIARGALGEQPFATTCGDCGNVLEEVRPGKEQCNHCEVGL